MVPGVASTWRSTSLWHFEQAKRFLPVISNAPPLCHFASAALSLSFRERLPFVISSERSESRNLF